MAVELLGPEEFVRIRLRCIPKASAQYLIPFVKESIEPGAQVRTDRAVAYQSPTDLDHDHPRTVMLGSEVPAHVSKGPVAPLSAPPLRALILCNRRDEGRDTERQTMALIRENAAWNRAGDNQSSGRRECLHL